MHVHRRSQGEPSSLASGDAWIGQREQALLSPPCPVVLPHSLTPISKRGRCSVLHGDTCRPTTFLPRGRAAAEGCAAAASTFLRGLEAAASPQGTAVAASSFLQNAPPQRPLFSKVVASRGLAGTFHGSLSVLQGRTAAACHLARVRTPFVFIRQSHEDRPSQRHAGLAVSRGAVGSAVSLPSSHVCGIEHQFRRAGFSCERSSSQRYLLARCQVPQTNQATVSQQPGLELNAMHMCLRVSNDIPADTRGRGWRPCAPIGPF